MMILSYKLCMTIYVVLYHVIGHVTGQVFLLLHVPPPSYGGVLVAWGTVLMFFYAFDLVPWLAAFCFFFDLCFCS